jgi:hypothetical protein
MNEDALQMQLINADLDLGSDSFHKVRSVDLAYVQILITHYWTFQTLLMETNLQASESLPFTAKVLAFNLRIFMCHESWCFFQDNNTLLLYVVINNNLF